MDERTQEIIAMIRASEGKEGNVYKGLTDEQFEDLIKRGGFKEIQNIYDAGWRREPVNPLAQINVAIDEKGNLKDYAVFDKDKVITVKEYIDMLIKKAGKLKAKEILQTLSNWTQTDYKCGTHLLRVEEIKKLAEENGVEVG